MNSNLQKTHVSWFLIRTSVMLKIYNLYFFHLKFLHLQFVPKQITCILNLQGTDYFYPKLPLNNLPQ